MREGSGGWAQRGEALAGAGEASAEGALAGVPRSTPVRRVAERSRFAIYRAGAIKKLQGAYETSGIAVVFGPWTTSIRKKIIGHRMAILAGGFAAGKGLWRAWRPLPLLQEQPSERGVGVLVHPLIQKSIDLLADGCGVIEARQLKALQRISGSRQQKVPRWLPGQTSGHIDLRYDYPANISRTVRLVKDTEH